MLGGRSGGSLAPGLMAGPHSLVSVIPCAPDVFKGEAGMSPTCPQLMAACPTRWCTGVGVEGTVTDAGLWEDRMFWEFGSKVAASSVSWMGGGNPCFARGWAQTGWFRPEFGLMAWPLFSKLKWSYLCCTNSDLWTRKPSNHGCSGTYYSLYGVSSLSACS